MNDSNFLKTLEACKKRLEAEGLFSNDIKKHIPTNPENIGLICNPDGPAIRDIKMSLERINKSEAISLLPIDKRDMTQSIVEQIQLANTKSIYEVLLIAHGGGTVEELLPWSNESVVRAIAESKIPVISAIGHEIDWSLSDYAADLRAATPLAAIDILYPVIK